MIVRRSAVAVRVLPLSAWLTRHRAEQIIILIILIIIYFATWPPLIGLCLIAAAVVIYARPIDGVILAALLIPFHFQHKDINLVAFTLSLPRPTPPSSPPSPRSFAATDPQPPVSSPQSPISWQSFDYNQSPLRHLHLALARLRRQPVVAGACAGPVVRGGAANRGRRCKVAGAGIGPGDRWLRGGRRRSGPMAKRRRRRRGRGAAADGADLLAESDGAVPAAHAVFAGGGGIESPGAMDVGRGDVDRRGAGADGEPGGAAVGRPRGGGGAVVAGARPAPSAGVGVGGVGRGSWWRRWGSA
ncbi:MAG: hypothetical protein R2856_13365 [Caldilineaceae bacterium]